jgi:hypothetical protein
LSFILLSAPRGEEGKEGALHGAGLDRDYRGVWVRQRASTYMKQDQSGKMRHGKEEPGIRRCTLLMNSLIKSTQTLLSLL